MLRFFARSIQNSPFPQNWNSVMERIDELVSGDLTSAQSEPQAI